MVSLLELKEILVNAGLLFVSVLIFLALFEVFLRMTDITVGVTPLCGCMQGNIVNYRPMPNLDLVYTHPEFEMIYRTNSSGFRDSEMLENPGYRIVGVGDSFTFGWGVNNDETYLNIAEKEINNNREKEVEIVNAGVGGFNNVDSFNYVLEVSEEIDYNMLVFAVFIGNDIVDNLYENTRRVNERGCLVKQETKKQQTFREFLYQNFYVVRFFSKARKLPIINNFVIAIGLGSKGEDNPNFNLLRKEKDSKSLEAIDKTKNIIGGVKEYSKANGKKLLVLLIPSEYQVYEEVFLEDAQKYAVEMDEVDNMELNNIFSEFFKSKNIDYLDTTEYLRKFVEENNNPALYYEKDGHFNSLGQELAGKALAMKLKEEIPE